MASNSALLVVDVQYDFLPGGALGITEGDHIIPVINEYIRLFEAAGLPIIVTRDWHPARTVHFNTEGGPWPPHCVQNTEGAAFARTLKLPASAIVVSKGMDAHEDSYSAFHARTVDGRMFESLLRSLEVDHLYTCGLATDYCVRLTSADALPKGFGVTVLVDAVRGVSDADSHKSIAELKAGGATTATLKDMEVPVE